MINISSKLMKKRSSEKKLEYNNLSSGAVEAPFIKLAVKLQEVQLFGDTIK